MIHPRLKQLLLCAIVLEYGRGMPIPKRDEDVASCLVPGTSSSCVADRSCSGVTFNDRSCLNTSVPWDTPYLQVKCCFRCCLGYWQKKLGFTAVLETRRAELKRKKYFVFDQDDVFIHRYTVVSASLRYLQRISPIVHQLTCLILDVHRRKCTQQLETEASHSHRFPREV